MPDRLRRGHLEGPGEHVGVSSRSSRSRLNRMGGGRRESPGPVKRRDETSRTEKRRLPRNSVYRRHAGPPEMGVNGTPTITGGEPGLCGKGNTSKRLRNRLMYLLADAAVGKRPAASLFSLAAPPCRVPPRGSVRWIRCACPTRPPGAASSIQRNIVQRNRGARSALQVSPHRKTFDPARCPPS